MILKMAKSKSVYLGLITSKCEQEAFHQKRNRGKTIKTRSKLSLWNWKMNKAEEEIVLFS
jgi:hypothetical protein